MCVHWTIFSPLIIFSFLVPLFWTQTGYGLKPPPLLATDRTHEQHLDALKRHFERTVPKYGPHVRFLLLVGLLVDVLMLVDERPSSTLQSSKARRRRLRRGIGSI